MSVPDSQLISDFEKRYPNLCEYLNFALGDAGFLAPEQIAKEYIEYHSKHPDRTAETIDILREYSDVDLCDGISLEIMGTLSGYIGSRELFDKLILGLTASRTSSSPSRSASTEGNFFRYHVLGSTVPIRVTLDGFGRKVGAERPDAKMGQLVLDHHLLSRLEQAYEVEEIDETEFNRRCRAIFDKGQA